MFILVYKVNAGRSGKFPFKVYAELRQRRKIRINKYANYTTAPECECDSIPEQGKVAYYYQII